MQDIDRRRFFKTAGAAAAGLAFAELLSAPAQAAGLSRAISLIPSRRRAFLIYRIPGTRTRQSPAVNPPYTMSSTPRTEHTRYVRRRRPALIRLRDPALERPTRRAEHRRHRPHRSRRQALRRRRRCCSNERYARHRPQRRRREPRHRALPEGDARQPRRAAGRGAFRESQSDGRCRRNSRSPASTSPKPPEISASDLQRGDTVLIRTGWGQHFRANPAIYKGDNSAGLGVSRRAIPHREPVHASSATTR